jgi:hypothetical protein
MTKVVAVRSFDPAPFAISPIRSRPERIGFFLDHVRFAAMRQRAMPELDPRAVAAGLALTILVAIGGSLLGFPPILAVLAVAAGGYVAGRMAGRDGLLHGAVVGALSIVVVSIAASAGNASVSNVLVDTVAIVVSDVLLLLFSSVAGWLATRS